MELKARVLRVANLLKTAGTGLNEMSPVVHRDEYLVFRQKPR